MHDGLDFGSPEPGIGVCDFVLKDAEEPDDVGNEKISLHGIRELSAGQNLHAGTRARALFIELGRALVPLRKIRHAGEASADVRLGACTVHDEILTPAVENMAVRVGKIIGYVSFEFVRPWLVAINDSLLEIKRAAGIENEAVGRMMSVG